MLKVFYINISDDEQVKPEHMKRKDRKVMRQAKENNNYELCKNSKALWNELRRMDLKNERRVELSTKLYKMIQGKMKKVKQSSNDHDKYFLD